MVELLSGAKIEYNWKTVSQKEWLFALTNETDVTIMDPFIGKLVGMTADELSDLSPIDYARIKKGVIPSYKEGIDVSTSKNLAGESTLD